VTPRLNYREAARLLGIPVGTLRSMVCRRQVPHIRISPRVVVFDVAALEEWIALRRVGVANEDAASLDGDDRAA
jgi:excisionase family DNA binding protein